ncbi:ankyrin repeat domain-containing protein [Mucilaginibacter sp. SMC90]|uniref:ankyrin repeat domain-containing protein n=1 Tax=Mucilaginibacter sp. SMC90 TaxID=2929803 RepID=UPI001FB4C462|nr:ankyrin repeat domain-containing protein [Mucilaginibacter sp. SMC90]UOE51727.1 ankyrin repeat domain-containing protein [Mucilaginibacter sp. SMC90]
MIKFIRYVKDLDVEAVKGMIEKDPRWLTWAEDSGKNALHYLGGVEIGKRPDKAEDSLTILKLLLDCGMDINSIHRIKEECGFFPATPLWYAYTRGRNELLYKYLLAKGADPEQCMYAITWYNDIGGADLFKSYGAQTDSSAGIDTPFMAAYNWKRFEIAEWFLKNGADVNFADKDGNTTLFYAVKRKYKLDQIRLLLRFGADFNKENKQGISAKKFAEQNNQTGILKLFKE